MPPPKDLPGFYFDPDKNRYFPIKGPIPGLKRPSSSSISGESSDSNKRHHISKARRRERIKPLELLQFRELMGRVIMSNRCRHNFKQEYEKLQASCPQVWKYQGIAVNALEQMSGIVQTPKGLKEACLLSVGSINGSISLYEVGNAGQCFDSGSRCTPEPVWPEGTKFEARNNVSVGSIWCSPEASTSFSSSVTCIRRIGRHSPDLADDASSFQRALIIYYYSIEESSSKIILCKFGSLTIQNMVTTLGSGVSGGSVHIMNLAKPLDFRPSVHLHRRTLKVASFDCTMWTADCSWNGTHAVIGTNMGAALIDLETRASSWVYRTKSDIFSQQFDHSGNIVLCGLRNGAIIEVDVREKQSRSSQVSFRHTTVPSGRRVNFASPIRDGKRSKQRFEAKRNSSSTNPFMPSAVCSLVALQSDDQYFLGSSMDGSIKLFDRRLLHRGAIQSYEGHVNSHSHLQLGVNPSETLMLSGGEDRCVRIWSIKTSELIFEENVSDSIISTVCWPHGDHGFVRRTRYFEENPFGLNHSWGAWLGSHEGLFYMNGT